MDATSFVGRRHELAQLRDRLTAARAVTVTGLGGLGKTRLAVQTARENARRFADGVVLVALTGTDVSMPVADLVAQALGIREMSARASRDALTEFLCSKRMLVILDACETQLERCADLVEHLLSAAPDVRIIATSRLPLQVAGEEVFPLRPLTVEQPRAGSSDAYELLKARAAVIPGAALTEQDVASGVALCRRLDGIPLAIELAAACLLTLSVTQVIDRLDQRFRLLATRRPGRGQQQVLRAALDGSFELCHPSVRLLWQRLSVFAGEFDLAAVEEVCCGDDLPAPDLPHHLGALLEQSVVMRLPGVTPRFLLLDTIREYGALRLGESLETATYRDRHRRFYAKQAAHAEQAWNGADQRSWLDEIRHSQADIWAALDSYLDDEDPEAVCAGVIMASQLWFFWIAGGRLREGRRYLQRALSRNTPPGQARRRALWACAFVAGTQGDLSSATAMAQECLADATDAGDDDLKACAQETLGMIAAISGDLGAAIRLLTLALDQHGAPGRSPAGLLRTLPCLGITHIMNGDLDDAITIAGRAEDLCRHLGERWQMSYVHYLLALGLRVKGEPEQALAHVHEAIDIKAEFHDVVGLVMCIELLAGLLADRGDGDRATRLLGAAETLWQTFGLPSFGSPFHSAEHAQTEKTIRQSLNADSYRRALGAGQRLDMDTAVALALNREPGPGLPSAAVSRGPHLTPRETQVAELAAAGLSNQEIADRLGIGRRTVESHVENLLRKLGFRTRTQIAAWLAT
ncbi:LuxR C-terminal-related transcriptional regulator [Actinoplanes sp. NPDC026670]|uniref:ATP-binding protein n=1 Tax=Actinoplanes sp. NPDC026670 TaxID=3154700 RepID=UPI0033EB4140